MNKKIDFDRELKVLKREERVVILLILAHVVLFVSFALLYYILTVINGVLVEIKEFFENIIEIVELFSQIFES
jgi:hypothetical protein